MPPAAVPPMPPDCPPAPPPVPPVCPPVARPPDPLVCPPVALPPPPPVCPPVAEPPSPRLWPPPEPPDPLVPPLPPWAPVVPPAEVPPEPPTAEPPRPPSPEPPSPARPPAPPVDGEPSAEMQPASNMATIKNVLRISPSRLPQGWESSYRLRNTRIWLTGLGWRSDAAGLVLVTHAPGPAHDGSHREGAASRALAGTPPRWSGRRVGQFACNPARIRPNSTRRHASQERKYPW